MEHKIMETIPIKEYLNRKGIQFRESNGELIARCIFGNCDADSKGKEAHLYFSVATSQYDCKKCGHEKAFFWTLQTRSSDEPETRFYKCVKCNFVNREY